MKILLLQLLQLLVNVLLEINCYFYIFPLRVNLSFLVCECAPFFCISFSTNRNRTAHKSSIISMSGLQSVDLCIIPRQLVYMWFAELISTLGWKSCLPPSDFICNLCLIFNITTNIRYKLHPHIVKKKCWMHCTVYLLTTMSHFRHFQGISWLFTGGLLSHSPVLTE